jgi:hypothetical protein
MRPILVTLLLAAAACRAQPAEPPTDLDWAKRAADMVQTVLEADRAIYTQQVVDRLVRQQQAIEASEEWKSEHGKLPLPAQMLRMSAARVLEARKEVSYVLLSTWPINQQNRPRTELELQALAHLETDPETPFYGTEDLGGTTYFTAAYADVALAPACVTCHNDHRDSPRRDFELGDTMGALVIRFPLTQR